jgi:hypothetical protein
VRVEDIVEDFEMFAEMTKRLGEANCTPLSSLDRHMIL